MDAIPPDSVDLDHSIICFDYGYAVCRIVEGVDLQGEQMQQICAEIDARMPASYGMILDETNPYSMRFEAMLVLKNNSRLQCMAVAAYRPVTWGTAKMAFYVINKPYQIFPDLDAARSWMQLEINRLGA